jgi:thiamine biosynthesis lipoprotein
VIPPLARRLFLIPLIFLSFILGCRVGGKWHTSTFLFFDTICQINVFSSASDFKTAQEEVFQVFKEVEEHFSPGTKDYSSPVVLELFHRALNVYHDSDGCFDITVAPLSRIWGFLGNQRRLPLPQQIKSALRLIGMEKVKEQNGSLILLPGMEFDWGGIAKGFGIDLASKSLIEMGISRGFINAGGDLYCWGTNPDDKPWNIGIEHPRKKRYFGVISISGLGAATTGDYQRYFMRNGVRYHHVFDPKTGYPARGKRSVTVVGPETVLCDALSTTLFVSQQPEKILEKYPDYGAIIIDSEGTISKLGKPYPFRRLE